MSPALQARLLRAIEDKTITRVGGTKASLIDVRVIAATNMDLDLRERQGLFRRDLLYRLNTVQFVLPPLRRRREDLPALTNYFIARTAQESVIVGCFNDLDAVETLVRRNAGQLAAVLAEPILADAGIIPPEPGFLDGLRTICNENGVLLIFDEIITGFRVALGGAQQLYDVMPDITCVAKAVGGGTPGAAAFGGKKEIMALEADEIDISTKFAGRLAQLLVQEGDIAADYLERLLDIVDYDGDIDLDVENDRAAVAIIGTTS